MVWQALLGIVTGAIAAWITSSLALRKFTAEKLWEKQTELFIDLVNRIHRIHETESLWYQCNLQRESGVPLGIDVPTDAEEEDISKRYREDIKELKRIASLSPILLNNECKESILAYIEHRDNLVSAVYSESVSASYATESSYNKSKGLLNKIIDEATQKVSPKSYGYFFSKFLNRIKLLCTKYHNKQSG